MTREIVPMGDYNDISVVGVLPGEETPREAIARIIDEYPMSTILRERCYLRLWRMVKSASYADVVLFTYQCPGCETLYQIIGEKPEWCSECGEHSAHFEQVDRKAAATQEGLLEIMEAVASVRRATAFNRIQAYRRLEIGLELNEAQAFALHLWAADMPRRGLNMVARWGRDGQLEVVNRPHRLPGVEPEKVATILWDVGMGGGESDSLSLDLAVEEAYRRKDVPAVAAAIEEITEIARPALAVEAAGWTELPPKEVVRHVREDLLGIDSMDFFLFHDGQGQLWMGLSYFPTVVPEEGTPYTAGRVDEVVCWGSVPPGVERWFIGRLRLNILDDPPERFRGLLKREG